MWLVSTAVRQALEQAQSRGVVPTLEAQADYVARYGSYEGEFDRVLTVAGDVAEIKVTGIVTNTPSFMAMLFGGGNVTYPEIISALAEADQNPEVKRAKLRVDSSGGTFDGLFETIAALQAFTKPLEGVVQNKAASAAFGLVAQCDRVVAVNRAARVGSVGVVGSFAVDENIVEIANSDSPKKRPDVKTDTGKAIVREELDPLADLFAEAIATGRNTTKEKVIAEYGQGGMLLADDALKRGMIDAIAEPSLRAVKTAKPTPTASSGGINPETGPMDLNTLMAQHPDVYAAAVKKGTDDERDRVSAHLTMGETSGDMATAVAAINDGSPMTASLTAKYFSAGMNRSDLAARDGDDAAVAAAADGAQEELTGEDASAQVVSLVEGKLGISQE